MSSIEYGVTLQSAGGTSIHTFKNWGCHLGTPSYPAKQKREIIVEVPFSDHVLDFSDVFGRTFYQEATVTYTLYYRATTLIDLKTKQTQIINFCNGSKWFNVSDDYMGPILKLARCTCEVTPYPGALFLEVKINLTGEYA